MGGITTGFQKAVRQYQIVRGFPAVPITKYLKKGIDELDSACTTQRV